MAHHIEKTQRVKVSANKVWDVLKDFGSIERTNTSIETSPILPGVKSGIGTKRKCNFYDNSSVVEEIIEYQEGDSFKMILSEFSMPLKSMYAELKVEKINENTCDISMSMDFVVKGGPIGWIMGLLVLRPVLTNKVLKKELIGLAYHSATGNLIGRKMPEKEKLTLVLS
tara:strand:+ start:1628 stop:2134 length:507 start_codon:yes stop_codon:yes gene_type:complete